LKKRTSFNLTSEDEAEIGRYITEMQSLGLTSLRCGQLGLNAPNVSISHCKEKWETEILEYFTRFWVF
jgi:hypothetical protein